ncbi:AAA family ATPase [Candidatus Microgenomates bacterium]|nr:AAA family ATPase [Candidatus Microgenomates bacterium CPR3]RIK51538.1 MAG: AAA family ATPase [Candidatus Microgenomates bacterium]
MSLPINIKELITGKTVEWERIEFKKGWNPIEILHSICAFANDLNNWGGGYIVIGIAEQGGKPKLPPIGVSTNQIDKYQKELLSLCYKIFPTYFPVVEPVLFQGQTILMIWVPGGSTRPYKCPDALIKGSPQSYYIRRFSVTKKASQVEEKDLLQMSAKVPYDDQIRQTASITDINPQLIQNYLTNVGSELAGRNDLDLTELYRRMNIVEGPEEYLKPKNIGLLMFNNNPEKFFPCARIDLIEFKNEEGDDFTEKIFTGPIDKQLEDALIYIKNKIIVERVEKIPDQAKAVRYYNYPFGAIEEALVNTIYHRSYEDDSPIEVRIFPNKLEMISYPGPLPPLNKAKLQSGKISARKYRNRRIGDFLKELHLTEGRGTGILKIIREMSKNGSPKPIFDTDDDLSYFTTTLPIHPQWLVRSIEKGAYDRDYDARGKSVNAHKGDEKGAYDRAYDHSLKILNYCLRPKKKSEIMVMLNLYINNKNFIRHVQPLIDQKYLALTIPDKPRSKYQQYRTTPAGQSYLKELK